LPSARLGLEAEDHLPGIPHRHKLGLEKPVAAVVAYIIQVNEKIFLFAAIFDPDIAQPVDSVLSVESAFISDQLLLNVQALDLKRQCYLSAARSLGCDLFPYERVRGSTGQKLHVSTHAVSAGEEASDEDRQQSDVNKVSTKPVPRVALCENRESPLLFDDTAFEAVPSPCISNPLGGFFCIGVGFG